MKISVIIPAYNSQATIGRALQSVLAQSRLPDEIIVVDDGSSDGTADSLRQFKNEIRVISQKNAGVSAARNIGITSSSGDWVAFLDADDEWLPDKIKLQTEYLGKYPDIKWMYGNFFVQKGSGDKLIVAHSQDQIGPLLKITGAFDDYFYAYLHHAYAWTSTILLDKSIFNSVGYFEPGMKRAQDNDLWYRIAYQYPRVGYISEPIAIYHTDTLGSSTKVNDNVDFMINLVNRHEELSKRYGRFEAFRPCLTHMLCVWIRELIADKRYSDAETLIGKFNEYLSSRFKKEMRFRLLCPPFTRPIADAAMYLKNFIQ